MPSAALLKMADTEMTVDSVAKEQDTKVAESAPADDAGADDLAFAGLNLTDTKKKMLLCVATQVFSRRTGRAHSAANMTALAAAGGYSSV